MSEVIGLAGRAGSGKTTAATILRDIAQPETYTHIEFSDPIFITAQRWLDLAMSQPSTSNEHQHTEWLAGVLADAGVKRMHRPPDNVLPKIDQYYLSEVTKHEENKKVGTEQKAFHRPLLEWLGVVAIELTSPSIWGDMVKDKIIGEKSRGTELVTVGGIRSTTDNHIVKEQDGVIIRIIRGEAEPLPSEAQVDSWTADYEIANNGTLEEFESKVANLWRRVSSHR